MYNRTLLGCILYSRKFSHEQGFKIVKIPCGLSQTSIIRYGVVTTSASYNYRGRHIDCQISYDKFNIGTSQKLECILEPVLPVAHVINVCELD